MTVSRPALVGHHDPAVKTTSAPTSMEALLAELREMRRVQAEILLLLRSESPAPLPPPIAFPALAAPAPPPNAAPTANGARRVLVIDSDVEAAAVAADALQTARLRVEIAPDGNAALAAIARDKPDAIVLDLEIGGAMSGKDVINLVRATMEWVDVPVVLYTTTPITSLEDARAVHGGDAFVPKPAGTEALVDCVRSVLRR